jgi:hypothetical protein
VQVEDNFRQLNGATDFKVSCDTPGQGSGGLLLLTDCLQDNIQVHQLPVFTANMIAIISCKAAHLAELQRKVCFASYYAHLCCCHALQFMCVGHSLYRSAQNSSSSNPGSPDAANTRILPYCEGLEVSALVKGIGHAAAMQQCSCRDAMLAAAAMTLEDMKIEAVKAAGEPAHADYINWKQQCYAWVLALANWQMRHVHKACFLDLLELAAHTLYVSTFCAHDVLTHIILLRHTLINAHMLLMRMQVILGSAADATAAAGALVCSSAA